MLDQLRRTVTTTKKGSGEEHKIIDNNIANQGI